MWLENGKGNFSCLMLKKRMSENAAMRSIRSKERLKTLMQVDNHGHGDPVATFMHPHEQGSPATVMIVDDTLENLRLLQQVVRDQGHHVMAFPRGDLALKAAIRNPPDIFLLDIRMPGMDGFEVCRQFKANETLRDIPVLFISALSEVQDKVRAFAVGGADYITKPFQAKEIQVRVEFHLQKRNLEHRLRRRNADLLQGRAGLEARLLQAEKMNSLSRISAGVAHEILNPVGILSLELQLLKSIEGLPDSVHKELDVCVRQVQRIVAIADNLKQFSYAGNSTAKDFENVNALIANLLQLYSTQMKIEGVEIVTHFEPSLPAVPINGKQIEQVLINLFSNALAAMEMMSDKLLLVRTTMEVVDADDYLRIEVSDRGVGIDNRDVQRIFEPFFTTKEQGKGSGMGLSIAHGIIREHGGRIWMESNEWGGAAFFIDLPMKCPVHADGTDE